MGKYSDAFFEHMDKAGKIRTELSIREGFKVDRYQFLLTKGLVQDYSNFINDHNPWYDKQSPFGKPICNPSLVLNDYLHVVVENGYNGRGGIYARAKFKFLYPLRQGLTITDIVRPIRKYKKRGRTWIEYEHQIRDSEGNLLITGTVTEALSYINPKATG